MASFCNFQNYKYRVLFFFFMINIRLYIFKIYSRHSFVKMLTVMVLLQHASNVKCSFVCRDSNEIFISCERVCRQKIQTYPFFQFAYFEKLNIYLFTYLLIRTIRPRFFSFIFLQQSWSLG